MNVLWFAMIGVAVGWLISNLTIGKIWDRNTHIIIACISAMWGGCFFELIGFLNKLGFMGDLLMALLSSVTGLASVIFLYLKRQNKR